MRQKQEQATTIAMQQKESVSDIVVVIVSGILYAGLLTANAMGCVTVELELITLTLCGLFTAFCGVSQAKAFVVSGKMEAGTIDNTNKVRMIWVLLLSLLLVGLSVTLSIMYQANNPTELLFVMFLGCCTAYVGGQQAKGIQRTKCGKSEVKVEVRV